MGKRAAVEASADSSMVAVGLIGTKALRGYVA